MYVTKERKKKVVILLNKEAHPEEMLDGWRFSEASFKKDWVESD